MASRTTLTGRRCRGHLQAPAWGSICRHAHVSCCCPTPAPRRWTNAAGKACIGVTAIDADRTVYFLGLVEMPEKHTGDAIAGEDGRCACTSVCRHLQRTACPDRMFPAPAPIGCAHRLAVPTYSAHARVHRQGRRAEGGSNRDGCVSWQLALSGVALSAVRCAATGAPQCAMLAVLWCGCCRP